MADGEVQAKGARLGPRGMRLYLRGLLALGVAIPTLAVIYGFHRGGAQGAALGLVVSAVFGAVLVLRPAISLQNWLLAPKEPPLWRHERLYWSLAILISAATLVALTTLGTEFFDPVEAHTFDGFADRLILGAVSANLIFIAAGRLHAYLMWLKGPKEGDPSNLQSALAPTLVELEAVRLDVGRRIRRRVAWMTPLGGGLGLTLWALFAVLTGEFDLILPLVALVVGVLAGYVVAAQRLATDYERRYKAQVLPLLVARFDGLAYGRPPRPDLRRLREFHVFDRFNSVDADDGITGEHQGRTLSIVQLKLWRGWGVWPRLVFHGLLVEIELSGRLEGTTAVVANAGPFENFRRELAARSIRRVGLESRAFESEFEVYATDQVTARALLSPSFMERFAALGKRAGFNRPLALAQDNVLSLAIPRSDELRGFGHAATEKYPDFFAPPDFEDTAFDSEVLERLNQDIQAVLSAADAVIALDAPTKAPAKSRRRTLPVARSNDEDSDAPVGEEQ
jgi:hypothetical protein